MFALAAIAVGAFTAFVGATSASAITELEKVVLCKVKEDPCLAANQFAGGTPIHSELVTGTTAKLEAGSLGKVLCTASTVSGSTATGQNLAHGTITSLTFTSCVRDKLLGGTEACTVTSVPNPANYLGLVKLNTAMTGYEFEVSNNGSGNPSAHVTCGAIINCTFGKATVTLSAELNASDTVFNASAIELERSGGACPEESKWTASYLTRCLEPANTFKACWPAME
jgi:hypothetical protein